MNSVYKETLRQIEPYKDWVYFHGLTEGEVLNIESAINNKFPKYFREYLKIFGVRQDLVFGLLSKEDDFFKLTEYLPNDIKKSFVVIGDNGGEDFWLLNSEDDNDTNIYEWKHWLNGEVVNMGYNFETLLNQSISKLLDDKIVRATNDLKFWNVQFAIPTNDENSLYTTLSFEPTQQWELEEISSANVHCYLTKVKLDNTEIKLKRQEYEGWNSPIYYFNLKEPVSNFGKHSLIKDLDTKLKQTFPEYSLIDYGILPFGYEIDEDE